MKKNKTKPSNINNQRARFDYDIKDEFVAGIVLNGAEVKSLRHNRASLQGAFVTLKDGEAWLNNMQIMPDTTTANILTEQTQTRARKLLLHQKELAKLQLAKDQSLTIVPLKALTAGRYIKIIIATAKGKKNYDKRQSLKRKDEQRAINRAYKLK